jgi:hypothetical protein
MHDSHAGRVPLHGLVDELVERALRP